MSYQILIVDDEPDVVSLVKDYFEMKGYMVFTAKNGKEALAQAEKMPDLILLDINMPGLNGLEVCRKIRDYVKCPILFLTARLEEGDKIEGFTAGGDDYITKPFSLEELNARVAAHLRREQRSSQKTLVKFHGDLVIDYEKKALYAKGNMLPLAKKEFEIVAFLSRNRGLVFDKERIYEQLWGYDSEGSSSVVAEHIKRIRAKFQAAGVEDPIRTIWGVGYQWIG